MAHIPYMRFYMWRGRPHPLRDPERFTHLDMARIQQNTNAIAQYVGQALVTYLTPARNHQFRYDEQNKLEGQHVSLAQAIGFVFAVAPVTIWQAYRAVNFNDFDRIERNAHDLYRSLSGAGLRQDSDRVETLRIYGEDWVKVGNEWRVNVFSRIVKAGDSGIISRSTWDKPGNKRTLTVISPSVIAVANNQLTLRSNGIARPYDMDIELHVHGDDMKSSLNYTIPTTAWVLQPDGTYKANVPYTGVTATTEGIAGFNMTATRAQRLDGQKRLLRCSGHSANTVEFNAISKPVENYPLEIQIFAWEV